MMVIHTIVCGFKLFQHILYKDTLETIQKLQLIQNAMARLLIREVHFCSIILLLPLLP